MMHTAIVLPPESSPGCGRMAAPWQSLPRSSSPPSCSPTHAASPSSPDNAPLGLSALPQAGLAPPSGHPPTEAEASSQACSGPSDAGQHSIPHASCSPRTGTAGDGSAPRAGGQGAAGEGRAGREDGGDVELRTLETKLELLSIQRQLSSMRCQAFLEELEGYQAAAAHRAYRQRSLEDPSAGSGRRRRRRRVRLSLSTSMPHPIAPATGLSPRPPRVATRAGTTVSEEMAASEQICQWRSNSCRHRQIDPWVTDL